MSSETVMLDMMRMLTLLNSGTEEEEEARTASSKDLEDNDVVVVEERMDVLIIGILMVACLGLILIVVAAYFFRKMVAIENSKFSPNSQISSHFCRQVICCLQKEREGTDVGKMFKEKINRAAVVERV